MQAKNIILELLKKDGLAFKRLDNLFYFIENTYGIAYEEVKSDFKKLEKN